MHVVLGTRVASLHGFVLYTVLFYFGGSEVDHASLCYHGGL